MPSGDKNVFILALSLLKKRKEGSFYDHDRGDNKKSLCLSSVDIADEQRDAVIAHCFSFIQKEWLLVDFLQEKKEKVLTSRLWYREIVL